MAKDETSRDEMIKEFLRKNFIKFYINIYKEPNKSSEERYMLDMHLFKGTLLVFADLAKKILHETKLSCQCLSETPSLLNSPSAPVDFLENENSE